MELQGKIAIITGASGGIGAATARELARHGTTVVLAARRGDLLEILASEIEQQGGRAVAVAADLSRRADIDRLVRTTIEAFGRVDILINNAGIGAGSSVIESDDAAMQHVLNVNLLAPIRCIQAVVPHMRRQGGGVIVNVGSVAGEIGISGLYSASKFGLRGLNDALRRELRPDNIDLVLIAPGLIRTAMTKGIKVPLPGPEGVARAIVAAVRHPRRKVVVPWLYAPAIFIAKLLPWLTDWLLSSGLFQRYRRARHRTT